MWRRLACGLVASYTPGGGNSGYSSRLETYACKCTDMESEIGKDLRELIDIKQEITNTMRKIDNTTYSLILESRYLLGKEWREIAEDVNYDISYVQKIHIKALNYTADLINLS